MIGGSSENLTNIEGSSRIFPRFKLKLYGIYKKFFFSSKAPAGSDARGRRPYVYTVKFIIGADLRFAPIKCPETRGDDNKELPQTDITLLTFPS